MNSIARYLLICLALLASGTLWAATPTVTVTYFYTDLAGSVVAKTDAQGNVTWRKSYASYGATTERDEDNRRGFTGHAEDPNGLVYMRNRYYDPESGRFWATDAVGLDPNNPASFNRYAYANNNPYKYVDPDGREVAVGASIKKQYDLSRAYMAKGNIDQAFVWAEKNSKILVNINGSSGETTSSMPYEGGDGRWTVDVSWNPNDALCTSANSCSRYQSPAMGLNHEMWHALTELFGTDFNRGVFDSDGDAENYIIFGPEKDASNMSGEPSRKDHRKTTGVELPSKSVKDPTESRN